MKSDLIDDYIYASVEDYEQWCFQEADRFIETQLFVQLGFAAITLNNVLKGTGGWYLFPAMATLMAGFVLVKLTKPKISFQSAKIWNASCLLLLIGAVLIQRDVLKNDLPSTNAPILVASLFASMLFLGSKLSQLLVRNLTYGTVLVAASYLFLTSAVAPMILVQVVEGVCGGTFVAMFLHRSKQIRFYHAHSNAEQRYFAFKELAKIVPPHVVKHIESGKSLETSMQKGFANACVISFDIIGSSKVDHPGFFHAVEKVMARCHEIMMESYDPVKLCANAYRIKDMGDGFLCSVGFPYHLPNDQSAPNLAVDLSLKFSRVFREEMAVLKFGSPLRCSIGLAQGLVEGFFPSSGVKQYDLRGPTLVLAKRYEALRNVLILQGETDCSFIILQDAVYQNISHDRQALFDEYDTSKPQTSIRDDSRAKAAYVMRLRASAEVITHPLAS